MYAQAPCGWGGKARLVGATAKLVLVIVVAA